MRARRPRACALRVIFLQGMMALAGAQPLLQKFKAPEKVARKSPFDRSV